MGRGFLTPESGDPVTLRLAAEAGGLRGATAGVEARAPSPRGSRLFRRRSRSALVHSSRCFRATSNSGWRPAARSSALKRSQRALYSRRAYLWTSLYPERETRAKGVSTLPRWAITSKKCVWCAEQQNRWCWARLWVGVKDAPHSGQVRGLKGLGLALCGSMVHTV